MDEMKLPSSFRLYFSFLISNIRVFAEHPINFLSAGIGGMLNIFIWVVMLRLLLGRGNEVAGFGYADMVVLLGFYGFYDSLLFFLGRDLFNINNLILEGGYLEAILTKPIHPLFHIVLRGHSFTELSNVLFALGVIGYGLFIGEYHLSVLKIAILVTMTLVGALVCFSMAVFLSCLSFFLPSRSNFNFIFGNILEFVRYPLVIYPWKIQFVFQWFIPLTAAGFIQLLVLKGMAIKGSLVLPAMLMGVLLFYASICFFRYSLRRFVSPGS